MPAMPDPMTSRPVGRRGADEILQAAQMYIETGNYQRAKELLSQALSQSPNDCALLTHYGSAEYGLGNYQAAAHSAYAALGHDPDNDFAMRLYSLALSGLGHHQQAVSVARRTVITHQQVQRAHHVYARVLQNAGRCNEALAAVAEALRLDPAHTDAHVLRGAILFDLGRVAESAAAFHDALRLDPGHAAALHDLALTRFKRGRLSQAVHGFLGAAAIDPGVGSAVRSNLSALIARVTTLITGIAAAVGVLAMVASSLHKSACPTWPARVPAGLCAAAVVGLLCWLLRAVPHRVLVSALRDHPVLGARFVPAGLAVVIGVMAAVGWPWGSMAFIGMLLLFAAVVTVSLRGLAAVAIGVMAAIGWPWCLLVVGGLLLLAGAVVVRRRRSRR